MQILFPRYYGQMARCNKCGCIIGYAPEDVNKEQKILCPQCQFMILVPFNPNYEGVIENEKLNDESAVV